MNTPLTELPTGWSMVALGRLVHFGNGSDYKDVEVAESGYPVYGSGGVFRRASRYLYDGESVLFGRKGTIDRPLYVTGRFWTVDTMYYTIPGARVFPKFLYYAATTIPFSYYATNTAVPSMTRGDLASHLIPLPPLGVQRAIADYLDHETAQIDALVAKQDEFIGLLQERRYAAIESAMAQVEPAGQRLKHVTRSIRQGWSPQCYSWPADGVEKWAVLKAGAANGGVFRSMENKELPAIETPRPRTVVRAGDLLISRANTRDLVGSAAVVDGEHPRLMLSDKLYAFDLDRSQANPRFVALVLGSRRWRALIEIEATGASSSMLNISQDDIANLPLSLPSVEEQESILHEVDDQTSRIDALIAKAKELIALAQERRSALITAAVTGQIDVRTAARKEG
ncbi:restriction endonuclease subunit S [Kocuria sabuli]|uniref:restriction endonuclease subunit S n=1 Tax=Kocuria sabuli TaxID=3071448 RepID=UPI0034D6C517